MVCYHSLKSYEGHYEINGQPVFFRRQLQLLKKYARIIANNKYSEREKKKHIKELNKVTIVNSANYRGWFKMQREWITEFNRLQIVFFSHIFSFILIIN